MKEQFNPNQLSPIKPWQPALELEDVIKQKNVCDLIQGDDGDNFLKELGNEVVRGFVSDQASRSDWDARMTDAIKVAMQVAEEKTFPWAGAANVKFPLITIAALQFHARAYASLLPPGDLVQYRVFGDLDANKEAVGEIIAKHMSWQLTEESPDWESDFDKSLIVGAIMGCFYKKTYFDPLQGRIVSKLVFPQNFYIDYYASSVETASRYSEIIPLTTNQVQERINAGIYVDQNYIISSTSANSSPLAQQEMDNRGQPGLPDASTPLQFIEQHTWLDLDDDGYKEPYVVTVDWASRKVARIVARFTSKDVYLKDGSTLLDYNLNREGKKGRKPQKPSVMRIEATTHYTQYTLIPSPDGGHYGMGFGLLLGHINDTVSTALNQLIDAGTMSNAGGGFLGKGARIRAGNTMFRPGEWKPVDTAGTELSKNIFPLPVREPSNVLFNLLTLLIGYGERVAGATDISVGVTPGQNTPAETTRRAEANGMRVFSAIYKRFYRSLKVEFSKIYKLNELYLDFMPPNPFRANSKMYEMDPIGIRPAADPNVVSDEIRQAQATMLKQVAMTPGNWNTYEINRRYLKAFNVPMMDAVLYNPKDPNAPQPPPNPKLLEIQIKDREAKVKELDYQLRLKTKVAELLNNINKTNAQIVEIEAKADMERKKGNAAMAGQAIAAFDAHLGALKHKADTSLEAIKVLHEVLKGTQEATNVAQGNEGNVQPMEKESGNAIASLLPTGEAQGNDGTMG